jgi:hypothetical protein
MMRNVEMFDSSVILIGVVVMMKLFRQEQQDPLNHPEIHQRDSSMKALAVLSLWKGRF